MAPCAQNVAPRDGGHGRAFFTRATRLADADFVDVPVAELVSKAAAKDLARSIGDRANSRAQSWRRSRSWRRSQPHHPPVDA